MARPDATANRELFSIRPTRTAFAAEQFAMRRWCDGLAIAIKGCQPQRRPAMPILFAQGCFLVGQSAMGAIFHVDDDAVNDPGPGNPLVSDPLEDGSSDHPFDSIQEAIGAAAAGDEVLVLDGTYRGAGNVNVDLLGKAITVRSLNGPAETLVDCEGIAETRGFVFQTNEFRNTVLDGFTIANGNMNGATPSQRRGGGVYCFQSGPTIRNCLLTANSAFEGGGMASVFGEPFIVRTRFIENTSTAEGGGIFNVDGYPKLINSELRGNAAGGSGGAMYNFSCSFGDGPGPELTNCLIVDNTAQGSGGGIASVFVCYTVLVHCTVAGNTAAAGGGIVHADFNPVLIFNSILWGNLPDSIDGSMALVDPEIWYSDIEGGFAGTGNIDEDPMFADAPNGDYHLALGSPCIDAGNPWASDEADLDGNGVTNEPLPFDLDDTLRIKGGAVDMGAYELEVSGPAIPTVAGWGMVIMVLVLLAVGSVAAKRASRIDVIVDA